ncbi:MAG: M14 family zinc carboxypeptidase [Actinomycetes bacterium]
MPTPPGRAIQVVLAPVDVVDDGTHPGPDRSVPAAGKEAHALPSHRPAHACVVLLAVAALALVSSPVAASDAEGASTASSSTATVHERRLVGRSVQDRPIYAYRKGSPTARRTVVVLGQMHGNERAVRPTARYLTGLAVSRDVDLWIVPTMNPDGAAHRSRRNARGVDFNRNYGHRWQRSSRGSVTYGGARPSSEPETRAVVRFLNDVDPRHVVSLHQPLYGVDTDGVKDRGLMRRLVRETGLPARRFSCTGVCRGTLTGWFDAHHPGAATTVEFGRAPGTHWRQAKGRAILRAVGAR